MRLIKLLAGILTVLALIAMIAGCGGGGGGDNNSAPTLVSITVTPDGSTIAAGTTRQFGALGTFSDNSTADLTATATWSSSNGAVASAGNATGSKGAVSGIGAGTTAIIAMVGKVSGSTSVTVTGGSAVPANVMTITVNGSLCSESSYLNKPCVSVTICNPGSSTCRTIPDILLDTGSYGLRVFKEAIPGLTLDQIASGTGSLAECVQFADGSSLWGPVQRAGVQLGNEPVVQVPIQVVDASFGTRPSSCADAHLSRDSAPFNGILGIGTAIEDCGSACANAAGIGIYYRCIGASCSGTAVPLANQVQNPVALLPQDSNGLLVRLPAVPLGGVASVTGSVIFGIATQANNTPSAITVFPTDQFGTFRTIYNDVNNTSFVDTGSNGLFFPNDTPVLPNCPEPNSEWYCPPVTRALFATTIGATPGSPSEIVPFSIGNLVQLASTPNNVFQEIGGVSDFGFDWGLPFFMGRDVFVGIEGKGSSLGTGPYVAY